MQAFTKYKNRFNNNDIKRQFLYLNERCVLQNEAFYKQRKIILRVYMK